MWNHELMFGIQKPLYMRKQQENKERELILGFVHLTTDITVKGSLREIPHTDQLFADLCENRVSSVFHKLLFRVTTVAYESHYVFFFFFFERSGRLLASLI